MTTSIFTFSITRLRSAIGSTKSQPSSAGSCIGLHMFSTLHIKMVRERAIHGAQIISHKGMAECDFGSNN
jgi:hypothetical protein